MPTNNPKQWIHCLTLKQLNHEIEKHLSKFSERDIELSATVRVFVRKYTERECTSLLQRDLDDTARTQYYYDLCFVSDTLQDYLVTRDHKQHRAMFDVLRYLQMDIQNDTKPFVLTPAPSLATKRWIHYLTLRGMLADSQGRFRTWDCTLLDPVKQLVKAHTETYPLTKSDTDIEQYLNRLYEVVEILNDFMMTCTNDRQEHRHLQVLQVLQVSLDILSCLYADKLC